MSKAGATPKTLQIKRLIPSQQLVVSTECFCGQISLLVDRQGDSLAPYHTVLSGKATEDKISVTYNGKPFIASEHKLVGFSEKLPENTTIKDFLSSAGLALEKVEELIKKYDLEQFSYLSCAQLNATAARQIVLIAALHSDAKILIMNDPFQPFSGRWRENFAEELLEDTVKRNRLVVLLNLSFKPQVWMTHPEVVDLQIGNAGREKIVAPKVDREPEAPKAETIISKPKEAAYDQNRVTVKIPTIIVTAYKVPRDFILEPIGRVAKMFKSFSGAAAIGSFSLVVVMLGVVMFPNLQHARLKMIELGARSDLSFYEKVKGTIKSIKLPEASPEQPSVAPEVVTEEFSLKPSSIGIEPELANEADLDLILEEIIQESSPKPVSDQGTPVEITEDFARWLLIDYTEEPFCTD